MKKEEEVADKWRRGGGSLELCQSVESRKQFANWRGLATQRELVEDVEGGAGRGAPTLVSCFQCSQHRAGGRRLSGGWGVDRPRAVCSTLIQI